MAWIEMMMFSTIYLVKYVRHCAKHNAYLILGNKNSLKFWRLAHDVWKRLCNCSRSPKPVNSTDWDLLQGVNPIGGSVVKNLPAVQETQETWVRSLGWQDPLEEKMATHSKILAWTIPCTELWTWQATDRGVTKSQTRLSDWAHKNKAKHVGRNPLLGSPL